MIIFWKKIKGLFCKKKVGVLICISRTNTLFLATIVSESEFSHKTVYFLPQITDAWVHLLKE